MTAGLDETVTEPMDGAPAVPPRPQRRWWLAGMLAERRLADRGFPRVLGEMLAAAAVAAAVSLIVQFVLTRPHVPMLSFAPQALISLICLVLVLGAVWHAVRSRFAVAGRLVTWAGIAVLSTAIQSLMLVGTRFYLAGIAGDQVFRIEYATRLADTAGTADFAYPNLPAYYPRGWFWLLGRAAAVLHQPAWTLYKPYAIVTMAVGTVLAYVAWCLVLRPGAALLVSLAVTTIAVTTFAANEPYAWVFGALIPPLAAVGWTCLVDDIPSAMAGSRGRGWWSAAGLLGVVVGLLGLFYTLLLFFFVMMLVITGVIGVLLAVRGGAGRAWPALKVVLPRLVGIGVVALPFLALQWVPYLATAVRTPVAQGGATRFLPESGSMFPIFNYPVNFAGVLCLIGLVWGLLRLRTNVVARALMLVTACGYLWFAVSFPLAALHLSLLPFKIDLLMDEALRCAGVLGLIDGARWLYLRLAAQWRSAAVLTVLVLAVVGTVGELQAARGSLSELVNDAYSGYYPAGTTALGQRDPNQDGAWNQRLHDTIATLTGKPEDRLVVLATYQDFMSFWPYWNFQTTKLEYANPLADFDSRRAAIEGWARAGSAAELLAELRGSAFGAPDVFVFRTKPDGLHMTVTRNVFPAAADDAAYDVVFPARLFDSPAFSSRTVGPFTVITRR